MIPWLFLAAYASSGLAGLVYEVSWTRLLGLTGDARRAFESALALNHRDPATFQNLRIFLLPSSGWPIRMSATSGR